MILNNATDMIIWSWKNVIRNVEILLIAFYDGSLANLSTV